MTQLSQLAISHIALQLDKSVLETEQDIKQRAERVAHAIETQIDEGCGYSLAEKYGLCSCLGDFCPSFLEGSYDNADHTN